MFSKSISLREVVVMKFSLLVVGCLAALLTAIPRLTTASTPLETLFVGVTEEPTMLDPAIDYTFGSVPVFRATYERLVTYNSRTGMVEPELAASWEISEDGLVYTFYLRPGVKFHDGATFDAYAVKTAYERAMTINEGPAWMLTTYVKSIDVVDDLIVRINLQHPFVPFLRILTSYWGMGIPSPKAIAEHVEDLGKAFFREHAVGTGPYKLVEWVKGQYIMLERFEDYWRGWPEKHLDRIVIQIVRDTTTMAMLLERGEIDIAYGIPVAELEPLKANPEIVVNVYDTYTTNMIAMNTTRPPLNDVRVRQALSYSFDYDSAMEVFAGYTKPLVGQIPPGLLGYDPTLPRYVFDLDRARELLAQAGYPHGGFTLEYTWVTEEPEGRRIGILWQEALRNLGIELKITEVTVAGHWDRISHPETTPDLANYRWCIDFPDALSILLPLYHGDYAPPVGYNISRWSNSRINELIDKAGIERDEEVRKQILREIQLLLLNDAPNIWITTVPVAICMRKNVHGFVFEPAYFSSFNFYDMYKD
jgi:peptide/nickel transport system substrate-binding protein